MNAHAKTTSRMKRLLCSAVIAAGSFSINAHAAVIELITNGNFETGNLSGWTQNSTGGAGNAFYAIANGAPVPQSGHPTQVNPNGGSANNFVAVSDQYGAGGAELRQSFIKTADMTSLVLSFDWFNNTHSQYVGSQINGSQQAGRVDILTAGSAPFDTTIGVVQNLLLNAGSLTNFGITIPWVIQSSFDLSSLAPGAYDLRIGNGQCCWYQEFGVDNVSLRATVAEVPEPFTTALLGVGIMGIVATRRKKMKSKNV